MFGIFLFLDIHIFHYIITRAEMDQSTRVCDKLEVCRQKYFEAVRLDSGVAAPRGETNEQLKCTSEHSAGCRPGGTSGYAEGRGG